MDIYHNGSVIHLPVHFSARLPCTVPWILYYKKSNFTSAQNWRAIYILQQNSLSSVMKAFTVNKQNTWSVAQVQGIWLFIELHYACSLSIRMFIGSSEHRRSSTDRRKQISNSIPHLGTIIILHAAHKHKPVKEIIKNKINNLKVYKQTFSSFTTPRKSLLLENTILPEKKMTCAWVWSSCVHLDSQLSPDYSFHFAPTGEV